MFRARYEPPAVPTPSGGSFFKQNFVHRKPQGNLGPLPIGKTRVVIISDAHTPNLGNKNFNKYNVWQRLVELAVVFGKHEELDELLAKID